MQVRDDWNHKVSTENKVLMTKIYKIMCHGTELTQLPDSAKVLRNNLAHMSQVQEQTYRRELARENKMLADRLRTLEPNYVRAKHARDYSKSLAFRHNISRADKLARRLNEATSRALPKRDEGTFKLLTLTDVDLTREALRTPGLELRTAKQVRDDTAAAHGYAVEPDPTRLLQPTPSSLEGAVPDYGERLRE